MVKESSNTKKIVTLVLFILVLCLLGLALIGKSYATMKDVEPQFSGGNDANCWVTGVTPSFGTATDYSGIWTIPACANYNVLWSAYSDVLNLAPLQSGSAWFAAGTASSVQYPQVAVSYTMQVA